MAEPTRKKNPHAVELAKLGARKGGLARAASLSPRKRSEAARKAVNARWERYRKSRTVAEFTRQLRPPLVITDDIAKSMQTEMRRAKWFLKELGEPKKKGGDRNMAKHNHAAPKQPKEKIGKSVKRK